MRDSGNPDRPAPCRTATYRQLVADIGGLIGISRQAAQQRFGEGPSGDEPSRADGDDLIVRSGATAFNELRMLNEEGRKGHELLDVGLLELLFRKSGDLWEYERVTSLFPIATRRDMARDGWEYVSSWYPFHYFKRRQAG